MKNWDKNLNNYVSDDKAFIFDLDLNEKYRVNDVKNAIYSHKNYGPTFGNKHGIYLGDNFCSDKKCGYYYHANNTFYQYSSNINNKSLVYFICEEIEVYQIIFDN